MPRPTTSDIHADGTLLCSGERACLAVRGLRLLQRKPVEGEAYKSVYFSQLWRPEVKVHGANMVDFR